MVRFFWALVASLSVIRKWLLLCAASLEQSGCCCMNCQRLALEPSFHKITHCTDSLCSLPCHVIAVRSPLEMFSSVKQDYLRMGMNSHIQSINVLCLAIRVVTLPALCWLWPCRGQCSAREGPPGVRARARCTAAACWGDQYETSAPSIGTTLTCIYHVKKSSASQVPIQGSMCVLPGGLHGVVSVWMHCICSWKLWLLLFIPQIRRTTWKDTPQCVGEWNADQGCKDPTSSSSVS